MSTNERLNVHERLTMARGPVAVLSGIGNRGRLKGHVVKEIDTAAAAKVAKADKKQAAPSRRRSAPISSLRSLSLPEGSTATTSAESLLCFE